MSKHGLTDRTEPDVYDPHFGESCKFNHFILCDKWICGNCGWNPVVNQARLARIKVRLSGIPASAGGVG